MMHGNFIIGFPGEIEKTVGDTIEFIKESGIDFYRTQLWYCDTLTPICKQRQKYDINGSNFQWSHAAMNSREACDIIDNIFLSVKTSLWLPQHGFDFTTIFHLANRGIPLGNIKHFIRGFNDLVEEKLLNPRQGEVSAAVMNRLKNSLVRDEAGFGEGITPRHSRKPKKQDIVIDFNLD